MLNADFDVIEMSPNNDDLFETLLNTSDEEDIDYEDAFNDTIFTNSHDEN